MGKKLSREEIRKIVGELEREESIRKENIKKILDTFDNSLISLYKEIKIRKDEGLTETQKVKCYEAMRKELLKMSYQAIERILKQTGPAGNEWVKDFIWDWATEEGIWQWVDEEEEEEEE